MTLDLMKLVPSAPARESDKPSIRRSTVVGGGAGSVVAEDFKSLFKEKLGALVDVTQESSRLTRDFAAGKVDNIHEVMISAAKSGLAIDTALQIRNLAIGAYQKLSQLR
jgi:flagellar hook-basal body complex protein FliE